MRRRAIITYPKKKIPIRQIRCPAEQVNAISNASEKVTARAGDMIYEKGDKAEDFFIVLDGEVTLKLPGAPGVNIVIDQLRRGAVFGGALGYGRSSYALSAYCSGDARLLSRYIDTMKKLQSIVMNLPVEA